MVMLKGNLPGEPPPEIVPTIELSPDTSCGGCPFAVVRDIRVIGCMAHEKTIGMDTPRPTWCPLDSGPVTVEIRKR